MSINRIYTAPDEKVYTVNNNGNNTVFTWHGNISCTAATATTFHFVFQPDCNGSGNAVIRTDFKVNNSSRIGNAGNIKASGHP